MGSQFTPDDIFWGQLGGALESIDAGTTTVVDHSHANYSPKHCEFVLLDISIYLAPPTNFTLFSRSSTCCAGQFGGPFGFWVLSDLSGEGLDSNQFRARP